jgi:hypothetical protein
MRALHRCQCCPLPRNPVASPLVTKDQPETTYPDQPTYEPDEHRVGMVWEATEWNLDRFETQICDREDCEASIGCWTEIVEDDLGRCYETMGFVPYAIVFGERLCEDCLGDLDEDILAEREQAQGSSDA